MNISVEAFLDAAYTNDDITVKLAIAQGIDIESVDEELWTALSWAVNQGHFNVSKILIEAGANVNHKDAEEETVLMVAIQSEETNLELLDLLLENGADIEAQDNIGWTVLSHAVNMDDVEIAKFLLEKGANPDAKWFEDDEEYQTPREMIESDEMTSVFANF